MVRLSFLLLAPVAFGAKFFQQHQLQVANKHSAGVGSGTFADVVIAVEAAYAPFNNFDPVHGLVGFDLELIPLVCAAAGISCVTVSSPWKSAWPGDENAFVGDGFLNHQFDCTSASGNTMPRRATLKFSDPYTQEVLGAFIGKKEQTMFSDASKVHIGTVEGYACGKVFVQRTMPDASKVTEFENVHDMIAALRADEVDVALACPIASATRAMDPTEHKILGTVGGFNEGLGFMCHPGAADKVAWLNKGLAKVRSDGSMQDLCNKYPDIKCDLERTYDKAKGGVGPNAQKSQVTIAMEAAYAPFNDFDPMIGLVGFDTELVPLVCDAAGIECSVVTVPWKKAWPGHPKALMGTGFLNHEFDCTTASGATHPRRSTLKFSNPYTKAVKAVFVGKEGTDLKEDGKGAHIGTVTGFAAGKTFVQREMPRAKVTEYPKSSNLFAALESGAVDVAVTLSLANAQKHVGAGYGVIKTMTGFNDGLAFMCHPGAAPKIASLNAGLTALLENGKLEELCLKYPEVECDLSGREFTEAQGGVTRLGPEGMKNAASDKALSLLFIAVMAVIFI